VRERVDRRSRDANDLPRAEGHRVEAELATDVPAAADAVIDGNQAFDAVVSTAMATITAFE